MPLPTTTVDSLAETHRAGAPKRHQKPTVRTPPICRPPIEHQWKETSGQPSRGQAARRCTSPPGPEGPGAAWAWARGRRGGAMIPAAPPYGACPEARRLSRGSRLGLCPLALRRWLRAKRRGRRAARGGALPGRSAVRDRLARAPRPCSIHPWELHGTSRLVTRALSAAVARESIGSLERIS